MAGNHEVATAETSCILSGFTDLEEKSRIGNQILSLPGGKLLNSSTYLSDCSLIVCKVPTRGEKYLCGCIAEKPLVTPSYITKCVEKNKWLKKSSFEWCNQKKDGKLSEEDKLLRGLPRRCKAYAHSNNGKHIFDDWKVLLHIPNKSQRAAYRRLVEAGGGKVLQFTPPFHVQLKHCINYAFATAESAKDLLLLHQSPFTNILYPEFITEYLVNIQLGPMEGRVKRFKHFKDAPAKKSLKTNHSASPNQPTIMQMFQKKRKSNACDDTITNSTSTPSSKRVCTSTVTSSTTPVETDTSDSGDTSSSSATGPIHPRARVAAAIGGTRGGTLTSSTNVNIPSNASGQDTSNINKSIDGFKDNSEGNAVAKTHLSNLVGDNSTPCFPPSGVRFTSTASNNLASSDIDDSNSSSNSTKGTKNAIASGWGSAVTISDKNVMVVEDVVNKSSDGLVSSTPLSLESNRTPNTYRTITLGNSAIVDLVTPVGVSQGLSSVPATVDLLTPEITSRSSAKINTNVTNGSAILIPDSPLLKKFVPSVQHGSCIDLLSDEDSLLSPVTQRTSLTAGNVAISTEVSHIDMMDVPIDDDPISVLKSAVNNLVEIIEFHDSNSSLEARTKSTVEIPDSPVGGPDSAVEIPDSPVVRPASPLDAPPVPQVLRTESTVEISDSPAEKAIGAVKYPDTGNVVKIPDSPAKQLHDQAIRLVNTAKALLTPEKCIPTSLDKSLARKTPTKEITTMSTCTSSKRLELGDAVFQSPVALKKSPGKIVKSPAAKRYRNESGVGMMKNLLSPSTILCRQINILTSPDKDDLGTPAPIIDKPVSMFSNSSMFGSGAQPPSDDGELMVIPDSPVKEENNPEPPAKHAMLKSSHFSPLKFPLKSPAKSPINMSLKKSATNSPQSVILKKSPEQSRRSPVSKSACKSGNLLWNKSWEPLTAHSNSSSGHSAKLLSNAPLRDSGSGINDMNQENENNQNLNNQAIAPAPEIMEDPHLSSSKTNYDDRVDDTARESRDLLISSGVESHDSVRMRLDYGSVLDVPQFTDSQEDTDPEIDTFKGVVTEILKDYKEESELTVFTDTTMSNNALKSPNVVGTSAALTTPSDLMIKEEEESCSGSKKITSKELTPLCSSNSKKVQSSGKKKVQTQISFLRSPSKYASIQRDFTEVENRMKKEQPSPSKPSPVRRSSFGRQQKRKKFSSDYVTPPARKNTVKRSLGASLQNQVKEVASKVVEQTVQTDISKPDDVAKLETNVDGLIRQSPENKIYTQVETVSLAEDETPGTSEELLPSQPLPGTNDVSLGVLDLESSAGTVVAASTAEAVHMDSNDDTTTYIPAEPAAPKSNQENELTFASLENVDESATVGMDSTKAENTAKAIHMDSNDDTATDIPAEPAAPKSNQENELTSASLENVDGSVTVGMDSTKAENTAEAIHIDSNDDTATDIPAEPAAPKSNQENELISASLENVDESATMGVDSIKAENTDVENFEESALTEDRGDAVVYIASASLHLFHRKESKSDSIVQRATFSRQVENMIEASLDQSNRRDALKTIIENASAFYYPKPKTIALLFDMLLREKSIVGGAEIYSCLDNIALWHPVEEIVEDYYLALQRPVENDQEQVTGTVTPIEFLMEIFHNIAEALKMDANDRSKNYKCQLMLFKFLASLMYVNFSQVCNRLVKNNENKGVLEKLRKTLIWKVMWSSSQDPTVNKSVKEFIHTTLSTASQLYSDEEYSLSEMMISLTSLVAQCCCMKDRINSGVSYSTYSANFVLEFQLKCQQLLFRGEGCEGLTWKTWLFGELRPRWLCWRVVEFLLVRYKDKFVPEEKKHFLEKTLSWEKIVYCYFFLYPKMTAVPNTTKNSATADNSGRPVNPTANGTASPQTSTSKGRRSNVSNLEKKNMKGETQLQRACIQNKVDKVKELLSLGADPNCHDHAGWTPLHEACSHGHTGVVEELLKWPALDVYAVNNEGISSLHDAVQQNHFTIAKLLITRGGEKLINIKSQNQLTAHDVATSTEMKELLQNFQTNTDTEIGKSELTWKNNAEKSVPGSVCVSLDGSYYDHVELVCSSDVDEYLFLLMTLVRSFASSAGKKCGLPETTVDTQCSLFTQHLNFISRLSPSGRMFLMTTKKILRQQCKDVC